MLFQLASETVGVSLRANAASANITAAFKWHSMGSVGVEQESYGNKPEFVPLFGLKKIQEPDKRRDENNIKEEGCVLFTTSNRMPSHDEDMYPDGMKQIRLGEISMRMA